MNFNEFYDRATGASIDKRPAEEIMAEIDEAIKEMREKNGS